MSKATIKLAPGQACFYDELSGIFLNLEQKQAIVSDDMNTCGLLKAISDGKILVVTGLLDPVANYINGENDLPNYYRLIKSKKIESNSANINKNVETGVKNNITKENTNIIKDDDIEKEKVDEEIIKEEIKKEVKAKSSTTKKSIAKRKKAKVAKEGE